MHIKFLFSIILFVFSTATLSSAQTSIPLLDNKLFGSVQIAGTTLNHSHTQIEVSAWQGEEKLSSYFMGDKDDYNGYILNIPIAQSVTKHYAQVGEEITLKINQQETGTFIVREAGYQEYRNLTLEQYHCTANANGNLLAAEVYDGFEHCMLPNQNRRLMGGIILSWDGSNSPITGTITIESGATLIINNAATIQGKIILKGGRIEINAPTTITNLEAESNASQIYIKSGVTLKSHQQFYVHEIATVNFSGFGTFQTSQNFHIAGYINPQTIIFDLQDAQLTLAHSLNFSQGQILTNQQTTLTLLQNLTITSMQSLELQSLSLNGHKLTLGSASTDLTIHQALVLNSAAEGIITQNADLTLLGQCSILNGELSSTAGTITLSAATEITGGILRLSNTTLDHQTTVALGDNVYVEATNVNTLPLINVLEKQMVRRGALVTLDASESRELTAGSALSFTWEQLNPETSTSVTLTNANKSIATFYAPIVQETTELLFQVKVSNVSGQTATTQVKVQITTENTFIITLNKTGNGSGQIFLAGQPQICAQDCSQIQYAITPDTEIHLQAIPNSGNVFVKWQKTCPDRFNCHFTPTTNQIFTAHFAQATTIKQLNHTDLLNYDWQNPILISGIVTINFPDLFTLPAGVTIYAEENAQLIFQGPLQFSGTATAPIIFAPASPASQWQGLRIEQQSTDLQYVKIYQAQKALLTLCIAPQTINLINVELVGNQMGIQNQNCNLKIKHTIFRKNQYAIFGGRNFRIDYSQFTNNEYGIYAATDANIYGSEFTNHTIAALHGNGRIRHSKVNNNFIGLHAYQNPWDILSNEITQNDTAMILVDHSPTILIQNNHIYDNLLDISSKRTQPAIIQTNWWKRYQLNEIYRTIYDGRQNSALATLTINPPALFSPNITAITGVRGDQNNDQKITAEDLTIFRQCLTWHQLVNEMGVSEAEVNNAMNFNPIQNCRRTTSMLNNYSTQTGADSTRLNQCIQLLTLINTVEQSTAEQQAGILLQQCQFVKSDEW